MEKYINDTGVSTITHYEVGDEYILVKNKKGILEYCASSNSKEAIEQMKMLAQKGKGLSRYIIKNKIKAEGVQQTNKSDLYKRLKSIFS
jgi:hypothetical protein